MEFQHVYPAYAGKLSNTRFLQQQLFYPLLLWHLLGLAFVVTISLLVTLQLSQSHLSFAEFTQQHPFLVFAAALAYLLSMFIVEKTNHFPGWSSIAAVLPAVSSVFLLLVCLLLVGRLYYSRSFLLMAYCLTTLWLIMGLHIRRRFFVPRLALVPLGDASLLTGISNIRWRVLATPIAMDRSIHGIVVDLHAELPMDWQRFVADCALHRIPVYHSGWVYENVVGRIAIGHLSESLLSSLGPPPAYPFIKRGFDILVVLASLPVVIPFMLLLALLIRLDSSGPVFFIQKRVGRGDQAFSMLKFRSMNRDSEIEGAKFADAADTRVTRLGGFMRKFRLDELPQIWNILLGHMSLVGPRPEQICFVKRFEEEIPFYSYRHTVRPGITGWAQVTHGYTADTESTAEKLERDIYYIKYMSFWLDFSILLRTIRILITGFGAR